MKLTYKRAWGIFLAIFAIWAATEIPAYPGAPGEQ